LLGLYCSWHPPKGSFARFDKETSRKSQRNEQLLDCNTHLIVCYDLKIRTWGNGLLEVLELGATVAPKKFEPNVL